MRKKSKFISEYGVLGWCLADGKRYVPIAWTLDNVVRCYGCLYFLPNLQLEKAVEVKAE